MTDRYRFRHCFDDSVFSEVCTFRSSSIYYLSLAIYETLPFIMFPQWQDTSRSNFQTFKRNTESAALIGACAAGFDVSVVGGNHSVDDGES